MKYIVNMRSVPLTYHLPHPKVTGLTACNIVVQGAYQPTNEQPRLHSLVCYGCLANRPANRRRKAVPE